MAIRIKNREELDAFFQGRLKQNRIPIALKDVCRASLCPSTWRGPTLPPERLFTSNMKRWMARFKLFCKRTCICFERSLYWPHLVNNGVRQMQKVLCKLQQQLNGLGTKLVMDRYGIYIEPVSCTDVEVRDRLGWDSFTHFVNGVEITIG